MALQMLVAASRAERASAQISIDATLWCTHEAASNRCEKLLLSRRKVHAYTSSSSAASSCGTSASA